VPEGVKPGDKLQATTPSGVKVKLVVPDGAEPGMNLTFSLPKTTSPQETQAAIKLQSISRGRKARKQVAGTLPRPAGPPPGSDPALEAAATKLQSSFRGHTARNEQQEASRLQWMEYYRQPHVAEFERALELAVSPAEEGEIKAAQAAYVEEEGRRLKWLAHYLETGNLRDAEKLVVTSLEEAKLLRAQAVAANAPCACIGESKATIEERRAAKFTEAIKAYDWVTAEALMMGPDDLADLEDSKLRVELMETAKLKGDFDQAHSYAITSDEQRLIEDYRAGVREAVDYIATQTDDAIESAAVKVQARIRGATVRKQAETASMEKAAVKVQKTFRGHTERDVQEEKRRVTWLKWHVDQAEYEQAAELAISKEERDMIDGAKKAKQGGPFGWCRCCGATPLPEDERKAKFVSSVRAYDWDGAFALAKTDEERQDVEDSKNRVQWMQHYSALGQYAEALKLAILDEEKEAIENLRG